MGKTKNGNLDKEMNIHNIDNLAIVFNGVKNRGFGKFSYGYGYGYGESNGQDRSTIFIKNPVRFIKSYFKKGNVS